MITITKEMVAGLIPARRENSSKGDYGCVLVVAGCEGLMGAAVLSTEAALRGGAGLVTVCCPRELFPIPQTAVPEAMCIDRQYSILPDDDPDLKTILTPDKLNTYEAIAFGPGLGKTYDVSAFLDFIFKHYRGCLVLDADGLNVLQKLPHLADYHKCRLIMTPHTAEAARVLQCSYEEVAADRLAAAHEISERFHATALVKGHETYIVLEDGTEYVSKAGNAGMATGGSGDVLTGLIAAIAAQMKKAGSDPEMAAVAGAFIHGTAGDMAAEDLSMQSMISGDITNYIPSVFMELSYK